MQTETPRFNPTVAEQNAKADAERKRQHRVHAELNTNPKEKKVPLRISVNIAGNPEPLYDLPEHNYKPGQRITVHPALAESWINAGIAEAPEEPVAAKSTGK